MKISLGVRACCLRGVPGAFEYFVGCVLAAILAALRGYPGLAAWLTTVGIYMYVNQSHHVPFFILLRSSIHRTPLILANHVGLVDQGYRGPLQIAIRNIGAEPYVIKAGTSLVQLVAPGAAPPRCTYRVCWDHPIFDNSIRGTGGFGSTGASGNAM